MTVNSDVVGVGIAAFFFLYFAFNLTKEHVILKILSIFFALISLTVLPGAITVEGGNTALALITITWGFFGIFGLYFLLYMFIYWAKTNEKFLEFVNSFKRR